MYDCKKFDLNFAANYCSGNTVPGYFKRHPFFCHLVVQCDSVGGITGVPDTSCSVDMCAVPTSAGTSYGCQSCDTAGCTVKG